MGHTLDLAGDVIAAGTAIAGLLLVFMGSVATAYDGYAATERKSVRARYQTRMRFALLGFILALLATGSSIFAKWMTQECLALAGVVLLLISLVLVGIAAIVSTADLR